MAFFKFRKGAGESPASTAQTESVEVLRRRARHRLIGAAVLVLLGVVGFPILFDTQPRPVAVDIPIEIPDRNKAKPLTVPVAAAAPRTEGKASATASATPMVSGAVTAASAPEAKAEIPREVAKPETVAEPGEPKPEAPKAEPAVVTKAEPAAKPPVAEGARAQALLEGKPVQAAASAADGRFIVQVGAFADADKAQQTRQRVEKAGLKTYTHVAETRDGKRIRVRVGPFATRAEADKAAGRIKELDLPAAILTL